MSRIIKATGLAVAIVAMASSCALLGLPGRQEADAAMVAGALLDYLATEGYSQAQELEVAAETYDLAGTAQAPQTQVVDGLLRAVTTVTLTREYPNVTYTITRETDDQDTTTPTDDVITVTREADYGNGMVLVNEIVRPPRPGVSSDWDSFDNGSGLEGWTEVPLDQISQEGSESRRIGSVELASGDISAVWMREVDTIYASQIVKEMTRVSQPDVVRRTTITQDSAGESSLTRERLVDGAVVESFTVEPIEDPDSGEIWTQITRSDGSYAVVREEGNRRGDPRIVYYYNADGVLLFSVEEVNQAFTGEIVSTRTFYDEDGEIVDTREVRYQVTYMEGDEDAVEITRTAAGRTRTLTITESGDVYNIVIRGDTYRVRLADDGSVEFLDGAGNVYMVAEQNPDGSWTITIGGESTVV